MFNKVTCNFYVSLFTSAMHYSSNSIINAIFVFCIQLKNVISLRRNQMNAMMSLHPDLSFEISSVEFAQEKRPLLQKL